MNIPVQKAFVFEACLHALGATRSTAASLLSERDIPKQKILDGAAYKPGALVLTLAIGDSRSSNSSAVKSGAANDLPTQA